ncbi:kinase-like domain-containing protein [Papiliotrema laurentii]|uniref:Kinase-like domain-containing protein n=1 Tax=Papiliotrema laurentii TaxID=5418 RepID=A0AAD9FPC1_PAPLA|nr:kinase-like domain-containing protein [Papiliotrema laurentii]
MSTTTMSSSAVSSMLTARGSSVGGAPDASSRNSRLPPNLDDLDWDKEDEESFEVPDFHFDWGVAKEKPQADPGGGNEHPGKIDRAVNRHLAQSRTVQQSRPSSQTPPSALSHSTVASASTSHLLESRQASSSPRDAPGSNAIVFDGSGSTRFRSTSIAEDMASSSGSGGSGRIYGARSFQRVVSAPVQKTNPQNEELPGLHLRSSTSLATNPATHTASMRSTLPQGNSTAHDIASTWTTPGVSERVLPRTTTASTRRIAGLARFGGPARRVALTSDLERPDEEERDSSPALIGSPEPLDPKPPSPDTMRPKASQDRSPSQLYRSSPPPTSRLLPIPVIKEEIDESSTYNPAGQSESSRRVSPPFERRVHRYMGEQENGFAAQDQAKVNSHSIASRVLSHPLHPAQTLPVPASPPKAERRETNANAATAYPQQSELRPAPPPPISDARSASESAPAYAAVSTQSGKRSYVVNGAPYERIGILGKGGSSRVYSVMCPTKRTIYALKRVALDKADEETYQSYTNEIELLKRLRGHDRVIQLIDHQIIFGQSNRPKILMMIMECGEIDFSMLLDEQRGKPLNMNFVGLYWEQMLEAVQAVHQENVVHTDLKPANFVLVKGRLKIIDFGIAKAIANDTVNIQRDQQIGTVNYMSPEAIQRMNNQKVLKLSYPSDVWSLGCILYQMIYGSPPFNHITGGPLPKMTAIANPSHVISFPLMAKPQATMTRNGQMTDPSSLAVRVNPAALDTMKRCLAYRKEERLTIPELLNHHFLRPQSFGVPPGATSITSAQMRVLVDWVLNERGLPKLSLSDRTAEDLFDQLKDQNSLPDL